MEWLIAVLLREEIRETRILTLLFPVRVRTKVITCMLLIHKTKSYYKDSGQ